MFDKLKANLSNAGNGALASQMANIQKIVKEQVGPQAAEFSKDEAKMTDIFKKVYTVLPAPVRLAVKEDKFVEFCFAHKDEVLTKLM